MLDTIPPEVLQRVAYHYILSSPTLSSPSPLLVLNKRIYDSLNPSSNPNIYAKVFRARFDTSAAERRDFGSNLPEEDLEEEDDDEDESEHGWRRLAARRLRDELIHRARVLRRLRRMVGEEDVSDVSEEELWVMYFMLIENDGKNLRHLVGADSLQLNIFLRLCHEQHLLVRKANVWTLDMHPTDTYPPETVSKALMIWIFWLAAGYFQTSGRNPTWTSREGQSFVLRPYVFAAHKYETCFAPWTIPILPAPLSPISSPEMQYNPFAARLLQKSRASSVWWYGRRITVSPPMLSHAAIMLFFSKNFEAFRISPQIDIGRSPLQTLVAELADSLLDFPPVGIAGAGGNGFRPDEMDWKDDADTSIPPTAVGRNLLSYSARHDVDFDRLRLCYDSTSCPGLPRRKLRHTFGGAWEGTFSFFDFDAYALMLSGHSRALYEGPYGEQAQVWKMTETWVRPSRAPHAPQKKKTEDQRPATPPPPPVADEADEPVSPVSPTSPLGDFDDEVPEASPRTKKRKAKGKAKEPSGLPVHGPMMNAGLPTDLPSTTRRGLDSATAEAYTLEQTITQQIEALPGYERVPDDQVEALLADPKTQDEMDMILTGTGHSAWGRFILKGRVRAWDGLAILVKEYAPDSRGKWFYRGYITSTDTLVGRWRDTYTAESLVGYEGTFILNRR